MIADSIELEKLEKRRKLFHDIFPMIEIGRQRTDVKSENILKNSCSACGYLSLTIRDSFEICPICFWEDDGIDDLEADRESGPNHMTLTDFRRNLTNHFAKIKKGDFPNTDLVNTVKDFMLRIDNIVENYNDDKKQDLLEYNNKLVVLFDSNGIYGIDKLLLKENNQLPTQK